MGLTTILANLAGLTVTGVTVYALGGTPERIAYENMPCLIFSLEGERTLALPFDVGGSAAAVSVEVEWLLLVGGIGFPKTDLYTGAVTALENVIAALSADLHLSGSLVEPLALPRIRFGVIERAGMMYYGVRLSLQVRYLP